MKAWRCYLLDASREMVNALETDVRLDSALKYFDLARAAYRREAGFLDACDYRTLTQGEPMKSGAIYHADLIEDLRKQNLRLRWIAAVLGAVALFAIVFAPHICRAEATPAPEVALAIPCCANVCQHVIRLRMNMEWERMGAKISGFIDADLMHQLGQRIRNNAPVCDACLAELPTKADRTEAMRACTKYVHDKDYPDLPL